jgi:hypothetical protein
MVAILLLTAAGIAVGGVVATHKDNTKPLR